MMKYSKALFMFGMLLLAAFASAQEAVNVEAEASVMPNARRLNTYKAAYPAYGGYAPYSYGYPAYGYAPRYQPAPFFGFGAGVGLGFGPFGIGAGVGAGFLG